MQFIWNLVLSSLPGHVCLPGPREQAVNPALGGARSTSCYILLAERGPHKCLLNSQLIHNNTAGPFKSTKMKTCETIKLRFLGWWRGWKWFRRTVCFLSYVFSDRALGAPLRRQPAWPPWKLSCRPTVLFPFHREWFGTENLTPREPNGSPAMCTATIISFDLLQSCPRGPILLPRTHDITYIINNYNVFTDGWTDGHSLCLKSIPLLSHPSFPHPQFSHLLIYSLPGRKGQNQ